MTTTAQAPPETVTSGKLLVTCDEAAELLSLGRSLLFEMVADGRLGPEPVRFGRKSLFVLAELCDWTQARCPGRTAWLRMREGRANG